jgi:hypothetical protein
MESAVLLIRATPSHDVKEKQSFQAPIHEKKKLFETVFQKVKPEIDKETIPKEPSSLVKRRHQWIEDELLQSRHSTVRSVLLQSLCSDETPDGDARDEIEVSSEQDFARKLASTRVRSVTTETIHSPDQSSYANEYRTPMTEIVVSNSGEAAEAIAAFCDGLESPALDFCALHASNVVAKEQCEDFEMVQYEQHNTTHGSVLHDKEVQEFIRLQLRDRTVDDMCAPAAGQDIANGDVAKSSSTDGGWKENPSITQSTAVESRCLDSCTIL